MIINKSLFPVNRGFSSIADMQTRMEKLQVQLATGKRAETLSELGHERMYDMTIRARQGRIEAYQSNIQTVNFRIDLLNNVVSRLDEIEADARSTATSGGAGADGIGLVTGQSLAQSRLDEVLTVLRTEVNGRYMFGGSTTDTPPVQTVSAILDGSNGRDGFRTIVSERRQADMGADGRGRLISGNAGLASASPAVDTVSLTEAVAATNPQRLQVTAIATSNPAEITVAGPTGSPASVSAQFGAAVAPGDTVTIDVRLPDGTVEPRQLTAVAGAPVNPGEFQIGGTPTDTANNFRASLDGIMTADTVTLTEDGNHIFGAKLSAISTTSAAIATTNYPTQATAGVNSVAYAADLTAYGATDTTTFDIAVDGGAPVTVTINQALVNGVGNADDVIDDIAEFDAVLTAALGAAGVAGVTVGNDGTNVTFTSNTPGATSNVSISNVIGDADVGAAAHTAHGLVAGTGTNGTATGAPQSMSMRFTGTPQSGDQVTIGVTLPDGSAHSIVMTATANAPLSPRQFQIGATPEDTAANFQSALDTELLRLGDTELRAASVYAASDNFFAGEGETVMRVGGPGFANATSLVAATTADTVLWYTGEDGAGRARDTVQARVDDGTVVSYGVQANESGLTNLVRSLAAMSVETYPDADPNKIDRFNAMNQEQAKRLSESNNGQPGSIEVISLELGIAYATTGQAGERHTVSGAQLDTMLADIEDLNIEEVAVQLLNLQTRLEASYQTTASVARLSLVNFIS